MQRPQGPTEMGAQINMGMLSAGEGPAEETPLHLWGHCKRRLDFTPSPVGILQKDLAQARREGSAWLLPGTSGERVGGIARQ